MQTLSPPAPLDALAARLEGWSTLFADRPAVAVGVLAVHVVSMFVAGGLALGADRAVRRSTDASLAAPALLDDLASTHRLVIVALAFTVASGTLLLASDIAVFARSRVFWTKMALVLLLLGNGIRMRWTERRLSRSGRGPHTAAAARALRRAAATSAVLWPAVVVLGVILGNS